MVVLNSSDLKALNLPSNRRYVMNEISCETATRLVTRYSFTKRRIVIGSRKMRCRTFAQRNRFTLIYQGMKRNLDS